MLISSPGTLLKEVLLMHPCTRRFLMSLGRLLQPLLAMRCTFEACRASHALSFLLPLILLRVFLHHLNLQSQLLGIHGSCDLWWDPHLLNVIEGASPLRLMMMVRTLACVLGYASSAGRRLRAASLFSWRRDAHSGSKRKQAIFGLNTYSALSL